MVMTNTDHENLLTTEQVAEQLGVTVKAVKHQCDRRNIEFILIARKRRFTQQAVDTFIEASTKRRVAS